MPRPETCPNGHPIDYTNARVLQQDGSVTPGPNLGDLHFCWDCRDVFQLTPWGFRRLSDREIDAVITTMKRVSERSQSDADPD